MFSDSFFREIYQTLTCTSVFFISAYFIVNQEISLHNHACEEELVYRPALLFAKRCDYSIAPIIPQK